MGREASSGEEMQKLMVSFDAGYSCENVEARQSSRYGSSPTMGRMMVT